ncbi:unnamed protein product [Adineta steineri]|uniref:Prolyl 4-hydroxylase alpha subunit Fe(2+) 2OG dioxygenase domain-containing protein n=1 Tax=Adineta steineri TaxID=433720 RepID=A0A815Q7M0_9BILA|nr:unnamed protein product [Adineta steineri]CAF1632598.1 unnamed protein product [Adineta steineri]
MSHQQFLGSIDLGITTSLLSNYDTSTTVEDVVPNTKPLGFNAQGNWEMSSVNIVMRLNKYNEGEYFAPHKDAQ